MPRSGCPVRSGWGGRRPECASSWRPKAPRTVATGLPVLDHLVGRARRAARACGSTLEVSPGSAEEEVDGRRPRARRRARRAAALGRRLGSRLGVPAGRRGARAASSSRSPSGRSSSRTSTSRASASAGSRATSSRGFLEELADARRAERARPAARGQGHRARARGDLQGARRRARPGMQTRRTEVSR